MFPFQTTFSPNTYECGPGGSMKVHSLMLHLQEAAARHADALGWGMDWLRKNGSMWVLVNFGMDIKRLPCWGEEVSLFTWPAGHDAIRAFREYKGVDEVGKDLFTASSDWIIIDIDRKAPRILSEANFDVPDPGKRSFPPPKRLKETGEYPPLSRVTVGGSSIDMNTHVNNTEYIRWGLDALSHKGIGTDAIRSFNITFSSELFQGDEIEVGIRVEGGLYLLRGMMIKDAKTVFLMDILTSQR
jgi:medium-chain acyl-[acyl-carrier-protein] hydrolase